MSFVVRLVSSSSHGRILALWFCFLKIPLMSNVLFLLHIFYGFWIFGLWCWNSLAAHDVGYFNIDRLWNWTSVPDSWYGWATLGTDSRMASPVFFFVIMFFCLHFELLDCDAGTALLPKLLVISVLIVCEIQLLFLICGMAEGLEEQTPQWLHLCFSLSLCSSVCKVVLCL